MVKRDESTDDAAGVAVVVDDVDDDDVAVVGDGNPRDDQSMYVACLVSHQQQGFCFDCDHYRAISLLRYNTDGEIMKEKKKNLA